MDKEGGDASGSPDADKRGFGANGLPTAKARVIELRSSAALAAAVYLLALGGSILLGLQATVLDSVPFWLGSAAFLGCYGRIFHPRAVRLARTIEATFIVLVLGLSLACLSYMGAATKLPLRDADMAWIDEHLGFNWLEWMSWLDCWPGVLKLLDGAYATFTPQLLAVVLVLVIVKRARDLDRFFVTFVCASLIAELTSFLVPTLGPMATVAKTSSFDNLPMLGRATADIVLALREGALKSIDLNALNGIISFPSLHAAVAVIVPYTLRWNKLLFWPMVAVDAVMLISAIPSGNHYLTDVIGGAAVAGLAILSAGRIEDGLGRLFAFESDLPRGFAVPARQPQPEIIQASTTLSDTAREPKV